MYLLKALKEQISSEQGHKIARYDYFKFNSDVPNEPCIQVVPGAQDQCVVALEPAAAKV